MFRTSNVQHTQEFGETSTTGKQEAGGSIEIGTKLGKGSNFTVLSEVKLQRTGELLHDLAENEHGK